MLTDTNTLRSCKNITGLNVSVGAGIKETAEILRTDLLTIIVELSVNMVVVQLWHLQHQVLEYGRR